MAGELILTVEDNDENRKLVRDVLTLGRQAIVCPLYRRVARHPAIRRESAALKRLPLRAHSLAAENDQGS